MSFEIVRNPDDTISPPEPEGGGGTWAVVDLASSPTYHEAVGAKIAALRVAAEDVEPVRWSLIVHPSRQIPAYLSDTGMVRASEACESDCMYLVPESAYGGRQVSFPAEMLDWKEVPGPGAELDRLTGILAAAAVRFMQHPDAQTARELEPDYTMRMPSLAARFVNVP